MEDTVSTDEKQKIEEALSRLEGSHARAPAAPPPKPEPPKAPPPPPLPVGTQSLLDAQLGEALKIMRDYAIWVHSPNVAMEECLPVGDALARMMTASATLAGVSARLQRGEPETRHRMIVEHVEGEGEGGDANPKTNKG
jgi:hypothetical protein